MDEAVEIRRGKLKRLDTDEVAEKLSPDEVEEFRDAFEVVFIGPESDHWQCLSLTDSLTH